METIWDALAQSCKNLGPGFAAPRLDEARRQAEAFLAAHPKEDLYPVTFDRPDDDLRLTFLLPLSQEELEISRYDPMDEEIEPAAEALFSSLLDRANFPFDDPDNPWQTAGVDIRPTHSFEFTMAILKDRDKEPVMATVNVPLEDDEFAAILAWRLLHERCQDGIYSFNSLEEVLPELHRKIADHLEWASNDMLFPEAAPYAVFMDEVEEALTIWKK